MHAKDDPTWLFTFFNEIGILNQLSTALLEAQLPPGLIAPHFSVLNHLIRVQDGRTPRDLARAFQVAKTTMTHTLAGLERQGLIEMRPNPEDGRSKLVWITEKGRKLRADTITAMAPDLADLTRTFDTERLAQALPALADLRRVMDARRDGT